MTQPGKISQFTQSLKSKVREYPSIQRLLEVAADYVNPRLGRFGSNFHLESRKFLLYRMTWPG